METDRRVTIVEYEDSTTWARCISERVASRLTSAIDAFGRATLIGAGGSTPVEVYRFLSREDIDWSRVTVLPSDERWVPESSARSNISMIRSVLLQDRAAKASTLGLYMRELDPEGASAQLSSRLKELLPVTACLLGMGSDYHTASLFPGARNLKIAMSSSAPPVLPLRQPGNPEQRISLTLPALASASSTYVAIRGADKMKALQSALDADDVLEAPITAFLTGDAEVHHVN